MYMYKFIYIYIYLFIYIFLSLSLSLSLSLFLLKAFVISTCSDVGVELEPSQLSSLLGIRVNVANHTLPAIRLFYLCTLGCDDDEDGASRLWGVCVYRSRIKGLNTRESTFTRIFGRRNTHIECKRRSATRVFY